MLSKRDTPSGSGQCFSNSRRAGVGGEDGRDGVLAGRRKLPVDGRQRLRRLEPENRRDSPMIRQAFLIQGDQRTEQD